MSGLSLGTVNIDGIVTGLDTSSLINELANSRRLNLLKSKATSLETKQNLYTTLNTRLASLDTALEAIQDSDDFREFSIATETGASYSVTATGEALKGSYDITVSQLAKSQIGYFDTAAATDGEFSSATTGGIFTNSGNVQVTLNGGTAVDIAVDATTTLTSVASQINNIEGITAYVVQTEEADDTGGSDVFKMVIQADDTGQDAGGDRISITDTFGEGSNITNEQAAQNAVIDVSGTTITSDSNTITAVDGLTIVAEKEDTTSYTTTLALDTSAMASKVSAVVDAFNAVVSLVETNSNITSSGTNQDSVTLGTFVGESTPRTIVTRLRTIMANNYGSALSISGTTAGSQMGISTSATSGLLEFSSEEFIEALEDNQTDVESLFSDTSGSLADALRDELKVYIQPSTGIIAEIDEAIDDEIGTMEDVIDAEERRIAKFKARLRKQFTGLETITSTLKTTSSFLTSFFAPKATT